MEGERWAIRFDSRADRLRNGADATASNWRGETCLHFAVWIDEAEMAIHLIENGADPSAVDHHTGFTCLHWAAYYNRREMLKLLLEKGGETWLPLTRMERLLSMFPRPFGRLTAPDYYWKMEQM